MMISVFLQPPINDCIISEKVIPAAAGAISGEVQLCYLWKQCTWKCHTDTVLVQFGTGDKGFT